LSGPGAALESIVALTEAMGDPAGFPRALSRVVREALGAHRALIMVRVPGLGPQLGYEELSGEEAAGIAEEVLSHVRFADDVWQADDAFADPALREASQTVRTFELKSLLGVAIPYPGSNDAIGALYVDDLHRTQRFGPNEVQALQRLARAVGRVVGLLPSLQPKPFQAAPRQVLGVWVGPDRAAGLEAIKERLKGSVGPQNILLSGPTGVGKTVLARRLATECLGLEGVEEVALRRGDTALMVTQLMGSLKGDFTDSVNRDGAIQRAMRERKALFLDEVQTLDHDQQQTLLPLLDVPQRRFGRLTDSAREVSGTLHVILATNASVDESRWSELFRDDLWYRMSRVHVALVPLRERGFEVVYESLKSLLALQGAPRPEQVFEPAALERATRYDWPGNLRQLAAFVEEVALRHKRGDTPIPVEALSLLGLGRERSIGVPQGRSQRWDNTAKVETVLAALRRHQFVQLKAARDLRMSRSSLNKFLKRHGLLEQVKREKARGPQI
jgi:transcriptional regulator with GAF, ATPase, and Fis domain